jgi:hypothetical protein
MSLFSSIILPHLEKKLIALEPEIAHFVLDELEDLGEHLFEWIRSKARHAADKVPESFHEEEE